MAGTGSSKAVDPIAYRVEEQQQIDQPVTEKSTDWQFDASKLQNADVNLSKYGDDSSEANYNNPNLRGGENDKYKGENTRNTSVAYDKNATLENLNPDYAYGQKAQMVNSSDAGYIQRRNDQIASALYNAGKTSIQDVSDYLNQQTGFQNSTENERNNTIASVWKRLGEISSNGSQNENKTDTNKQVEDNSAVKDMEADLLQGTDGKIFGKNTADINGDDSAIKTTQDAYNVERAVNEQRIRNMKDLQATPSDAIAAAIISGSMSSGTQSMRDLMQYDSAKYQEVQNQIKVLRGQMNINAITSGDGDWNTSATNGQSSISNETADFVSNYTGTGTNTAELLQTINSTLSSNIASSSAQEQMTAIENDMANLQSRMKNLKAEANKIFKGDVPQYIVNAYIANRRQEIQDQMSVLESRYNMAHSRYQEEWNNIKWNAEFGLKQKEYELKASAQGLENYLAQEGVNQKRWELFAKYPTQNPDGTIDVPTTSISREEISVSVDSLIQRCQEGTLGNAQCAAGIQKFYLPYLGVDLGSLSAWESKQKICNEDRNYTPQKGDLIVMEGSKKEYGHIGIVTGINQEAGTIQYLDWNGEVKDGVGTETAGLRSIPISNNKVYGYYNPTKEGINQSMSNGYNPDVLEWRGTTYDLAGYYGWNDLSDAAKETVRSLLTYQIAPDDLPKTGENGIYKTQVLNAAAAIGREQGWNSYRAKQASDFIKGWNKALNQGGVGSANATAASLLYELSQQFKDFNKYDIQTANNIVNTMAKEFGGSGVMSTYVDLRVAASEVAKALKGNASATQEEIREIANLLTGKMSNEQAQEVFKHFARNLVDKNASEAQHHRRVTGYKPDSIYLEEVTDWMNNELGIDMARYYEYSPTITINYTIPKVGGGTDYSSQL